MDAGSSPADEDQTRILLLLVDAQIDFVHPQGSLSVPGAVDDTRRTVEWIFRNLHGITTIAASLDSHVPIQIFYPTWWVDAEGNHPNAYTVITDEEVSAGRWLPVYEQAWSNSYVEKLETQARKELMIWPYHTMIGSEGHNLMPALYEAIIFHSTARRAQPTLITKGSIPKTEHYSLLEPEVKVLDHPQGQINTDFVKTLATYDRVYIAGQAKSHCVLQTTTSLMNYFAGQAEVIDKLHVLYDCTSSVVHPDIDFDAQANDTFAQYERQGLHLIRSTDSIG
jgi:nicotinamidase-related amidase